MKKKLPGAPGPCIQAVYAALSTQERVALTDHLLGATSADWLAQVLKRNGHEVSATSIRVYRRSLRV